jgi:hypothetical protein
VGDGLTECHLRVLSRDPCESSELRGGGTVKASVVFEARQGSVCLSRVLALLLENADDARLVRLPFALVDGRRGGKNQGERSSRCHFFVQNVVLGAFGDLVHAGCACEVARAEIPRIDFDENYNRRLVFW